LKISEILPILDEIAPFADAQEWDNCGLLVGKESLSFEKLYLSLDITLEQIDSFSKDSLVIVHHPLIFKPLKKMLFDTYPSNIIQKLIQKNIFLIAMHTNFDKYVLNSYVLKLLGFESEKSDLFMECVVNIEREELFARLSDVLGRDSFNFVNIPPFIKSIALVCGSGGSFLEKMSADVLISGDINYHTAMSAISLDKGVIDMGHYELERFFAEALSQKLKIYGIEAIISDSKNPFAHFRRSYE